jgi:hypothetical protein
MPVKVTLLFQATTNTDFPNLLPKRQAGWTESWYYPGQVIATAQTATIGAGGGGGPPGLAQLRASFLPPGNAIVGQRYQVVSPTGPSLTTIATFPGGWNEAEDIPQQALLVNVPGLAVANVKRLILRGIPDARVVEGEFSPIIGFTASMQNFFNGLSGWSFRGRDLAQPRTAILSISAIGAVITETAHSLVVGQMVRILRSRAVDGDLLGGRFQVASVGPANNVFTLTNWAPGEATTGGTVRPDAIIYPSVDVSRVAVARCITRRVGKPFFQYRGRRSRRTG